MSILLNSDSYKASHFLQYPANTTVISSYIESRGGVFEQTLFFGLQAFIKKNLLKPFTQADIDEAEVILTAHGLPFNKAGWQYILDTYKGYLPLEIQVVAEGSVVNTHNVLVQVKNTDDNCAWLSSYIETALLRAVWYPTTVATVSYGCKQVIARYLAKTADNMDGLLFKLHDFGARGASSEESAALGGMAHLVNFMGSDTLSAIIAARRYYQEPMAGFSIPAAEHSTITSWGRDGEQAAYANMLKQFSGQGKLVAVVSDSYDLWNAIDNLWGDKLRDAVINSGGTLVIRPDSGDPVQIVSTTIEKLMAKFGYSVNSKGFKVLPACVRVIQGDAICLATIEAILVEMTARGLSADNIAFGMGGELLQKVNRDTQKFAMKASAVCVNGNWRDVFKDPITDSGKRSKKGRLALVKNSEGQYQTIREQDLGQQQNQLRVVYRNGELLVNESLAEIRARVR